MACSGCAADAASHSAERTIDHIVWGPVMLWTGFNDMRLPAILRVLMVFGGAYRIVTLINEQRQ